MKKLLFFGLMVILGLLGIRDVIVTAAPKALVKAFRANMRVMGEAIKDYHDELATYPTRLDQLEDKFLKAGMVAMLLECRPTRGNTVKRPYLIPVNNLPDTIISWCPHYHHIGYKICTFLDEDVRNILRADGTVGTVSEEQFKALNHKFHLQDENLPRPPIPHLMD